MNDTNIATTHPLVQTQREIERHDANRHGAGWACFLLLVFTALLFARPEDLIPALGPMHLVLIVGVGAGLCYVLAQLSGRAPLLWTKELGIVLALTGWFLAGLPFSFWGTGSLIILTQVWLKTLFIFFLLTQTLRTLDRIRGILWVIIGCELAATAISIAQQGGAVFEKGIRLSGYSSGILGWNFLGVAAAISFPYIGALLVLTRSRIQSGFLVATFVSVMWMLVLTASRGSFLSAAFSAALTWALVLRGTRRGHALAILFVLAVVVTIAHAPGVFWERMETVWGSPDPTDPTSGVVNSAVESEQERMGLLRDSIEYTFDHPVFGVGVGVFYAVHGTVVGKSSAWMTTHNTFTQLSSEAGIPALLLFVWLCLALVRKMRGISRAYFRDPKYSDLRLLARATLVSVWSFIFAGCFANLAYDYYFYYVAGIAVALQLVHRRIQATRAAPPEDASSGLWNSTAEGIL